MPIISVKKLMAKELKMAPGYTVSGIFWFISVYDKMRLTFCPPCDTHTHRIREYLFFSHPTVKSSMAATLSSALDADFAEYESTSIIPILPPRHPTVISSVLINYMYLILFLFPHWVSCKIICYILTEPDTVSLPTEITHRVACLLFRTVVDRI